LSATPLSPSLPGAILNDSLWGAQGLIFASLCTGGFMKLSMPVKKISAIFPWTGQVSLPFLRFIGVVDLAGGLGILLPQLTQIHPELTVLAALGCALLQLLAIGFHARRKEITDTPFNFLMLGLSAFVLWGRW